MNRHKNLRTIIFMLIIAPRATTQASLEPDLILILA
jgi:hypothetical protein